MTSVAEWPGTPDTEPTTTSAWPGTPDAEPQWPGTPDSPVPGYLQALVRPLEAVHELGKAAARGSAAGLGASLQGLGARDAATAQIMGQRLDESVAGALLRGELPKVTQERTFETRRIPESALESAGRDQKGPLAGPMPAAASPLYQAGEALTGAVEKALPSRKIVPQLAEDVAGAIGQVGTNIATSMIPVVGAPLSIAGILSQGPGEAAERATKAGATPEQQDIATSLGLIPGATEFVDLLIPHLGGVGQTLNLIKRVGLKTFAAFAAEGTQEAVQEFLQNAIEKGIYNPGKELGENVAYSGLVGGLAGGITGGAMAGRRTPTATEKEAYDTLTTEPVIVTPPPPAMLALPPPLNMPPSVVVPSEPPGIIEPSPVHVGAPSLDPTVPVAPTGFGKPVGLGGPVTVPVPIPNRNLGTYGQLEALAYDPDTKRIMTSGIFNLEQGDQLSADVAIHHDSTLVSPTGGPITDTSSRISMTQLGYQKFGDRFYEYNFAIGTMFRGLRDVVSRFKVGDPAAGVGDYSTLRNGIIGTSLNVENRGVRVDAGPWSATFINPIMPVYTDPAQAGAGMAGTMVHEFAHHRVKNHKAEFAAAMQDILIQLDTHPTFDFAGYKKRMGEVVGRYHDILMYMRGLYEDGHVGSRDDGRVETRTDQARDGGGVSDVGTTADRSGRGGARSGVPLGAEVSQTGLSPGAERTVGRVRTPSTGGDPSFGLKSNAAALKRDVGHGDVFAAARQPETARIYKTVQAAMNNNVPPATKAMAAHADKINWFYKYMAGLLELGAANPRFTPLIRYIETMMGMHREEAQIQDAVHKISKDWRALGNKQSEALTALMDDVTNMVYLTQKERQQGVTRKPTQAEFAALVKKHGVDQRGLGVYVKVNRFFDKFLDLTAQNAIDDAMRLITDPVKLADKIDEIKATIRLLRAKPYFPFMRFGSHYVTMYDPQGKILSFEVFERMGVSSAEKQQQSRVAELKHHYPTNDVRFGVLPEDVGMLYGMPPALLESMANRMTLSQAQRDMLEQLQFQMSPSLSFKHRFQHKNYIPGYSHDFLRAFAHYGFHGAKFYARTKYIWQAEKSIRDAEAVRDQNKAGRIATYMKDHLQNTVINAKGDWGSLKGMIFFWAMGYVPAAATANMTQTPMITFPYLAAKFGPHKAIASMVDAMTHLNTFYRKGAYPTRGNVNQEFMLRAIGYGIKTGRISETQAAELAALAQGGNLIYGAGGNKLRRGFSSFIERSGLFFEVAEQFNRRIAFRAALQLAMTENNNRFVNEVVAKNPSEYNTLVNEEKFSPQEARAILAANHATEESQFVYSRYARPRFMRGRLSGTLFVFKRYIQSVVMLLLNNKKDILPYYLLVAMAMGGLDGIPGWEDILGLAEAGLKLLGYWKKDPRYNKDIKTEIRRYILQFTDGKIPPDMILQGFARRGWNVAHILDAMGSYATGRPGRGLAFPGPNENVPYPILDRSKAITSGPLLPVEIGKMMQPGQKTDKVIAEQTQRASGAVFSVGFNLYKAAFGSDLEGNDPKRWERAMPRAMGAVSKALRTYSEERSRGPRRGPASASTNLRYDVRDTEQVMEIIAQGMGYNTLRESQHMDIVLAQREHVQYIEGMQKLLYAQFHEAVKSQNRQEIDTVRSEMSKFNALVRGTPDALYLITAESLERSFMQRERERALQSQGLPTKIREFPIYRDIKSLFPENVIDIKRR